MEQTERNVFIVTLPYLRNKTWEHWVLLSSDRHFDNPKSNRALQKKHLEEAKDRGAHVIDLGDLFCVMQGKFDRRHNKGSIRPEHVGENYFDLVVEDAAKFFKPYAHNLLVFGMGNHESSVLKKNEINLTERLIATINAGEVKSRVQNGGFSGWVIFRFKEGKNKRTRSIVLHYDHGYGGGGPVTADMIQHMRRTQYLPDANIIVSGHCFSDDTEILTPEGWKPHHELDETSVVATMRQEGRAFEWQKVNRVYRYDNFKKLHHFKGPRVDLLVTDKHGLLFSKYRTKELVRMEARDAVGMPELEWIHGARENLPPHPISDDMLRLLCWVVADGSFEGNAIRFHLKKQRKIQRLKQLLGKLQIDYTASNGVEDRVKIYIPVRESAPIFEILGASKTLPLMWLRLLNADQSEIVLKEYRLSDGQFEGSVDSWQLYSHNKQNIDVLQGLAVKAGYRACYTNPDCLNVSPNPTTMVARVEAEVVPYSGTVWCVNVDNGLLVVRRKGKCVVVCNTHDAWHREIPRMRLSEKGRLYRDSQTHIKCPTYKNDYGDGFGGWHVETGKPPKPQGAFWLRFYWDRSRETVLYNVIRAK